MSQIISKTFYLKIPKASILGAKVKYGINNTMER